MKKAIKIFLDTEFTGLHQNTNLISLGMVAETGQEFYAEFNDYDPSQLNPWLEEHVLKKLDFKNVQELVEETESSIKMKGTKIQVREVLEKWLLEFDFIEIWADVLAYDWVLFCELFGGAMKIPENIFYAPFDLATFFRLKGYIVPHSKFNKDLARFQFAEMDNDKQHHALSDAKVEFLCHQNLESLK
jgi:hypothetical protein